MLFINKKSVKYIALFLLIFLLQNLIFINCSLAKRSDFNDIWDNISNFGEKAGFESFTNGVSDYTPLEWVVSRIITFALSLMGIIFLVIILYGGYLWFTAGGNKQQVEKAIHLLRDASIGLALVIGAYAIAYYVLYYFVQAVQLPGNI